MSSCLRKGKGRVGEWGRERERERTRKEKGEGEEGTVEESREERKKISRQRAL